MDIRLEVVVLPVSDVDRAKEFYVGLGGGWMPITSMVMTSGWCS